MEDVIHQAFLDELEKISKDNMGGYSSKVSMGGYPSKSKPKRTLAERIFKPPKLTTPAAPLAEAPQATPVPGPAYEGL